MNRISKQLIKIAKIINAFDYFSIANIPNFGNYCSNVFQEELKKICSSNPRCSFENNSTPCKAFMMTGHFVSFISFKLIEKDMDGNDFHTITFQFDVMGNYKTGEANVHIQSECNGQKKSGDYVFKVKILGPDDDDNECKKVARDLFYDIYRVIATKF